MGVLPCEAKALYELELVAVSFLSWAEGCRSQHTGGHRLNSSAKPFGVFLCWGKKQGDSFRNSCFLTYGMILAWCDAGARLPSQIFPSHQLCGFY